MTIKQSLGRIKGFDYSRVQVVQGQDVLSDIIVASKVIPKVERIEMSAQDWIDNCEEDMQ